MRAAPGQGNPLLEEEEPTRDLVLGLPALLGIFLAVALVCAVCFGFGYSASHRMARPAQQAAVVAPNRPVPMPEAPAPAEPEADDNPAEAAYPTPKPQAGPEETPEQALPPKRAPKPVPGMTVEAVSPQAEHAPASSAMEPSQVPATAQVPAPLGSGMLSSGMLSSGMLSSGMLSSGMMVQIAAVSRAADAQTLANALRHDGFDAMVCTSTEDRFFHVQIGPFASPQAAKAMRTRLADNGYNAFIKP